ncbi:hypothetical protein [Actinoplanes subglobosus]|uniref:Uncharacterized protein n=1 Tax=Actinoplanes subglobosus TaxID=1547892 RepID=A0ABV8J299_9ACTN
MSRRQHRETIAARQERIDAVLARRRGFVPPSTSDAAFRFAADYARTNLLTYLYEALDAPAADHTVAETNRERARRGVSLSGFRAAGTLGDLFDAPAGYTRPGPGAETWEGMWPDRCLLDGLEHAHTLAELVLAGDIDTVEVIAGLPLADAFIDGSLLYGDVPNQVLSLAVDAFRERLEQHEPAFVPERTVDMTAPLASLPAMLMAARHEWTPAERLALVIAGLAPIEHSTSTF